MNHVELIGDVTTKTRNEARAVVARLDASTPDGVLDAVATTDTLQRLVTSLVIQLVRDLADDQHPVYATTEDGVSPIEAARLLGVSHQYMYRLLDEGRIPFSQLPDSKRRVIQVGDIEAFSRSRSEHPNWQGTADRS